ncbi:hypothetical protein [Vibrio sp. PNB22_4_1]
MKVLADSPIWIVTKHSYLEHLKSSFRGYNVVAGNGSMSDENRRDRLGGESSDTAPLLLR